MRALALLVFGLVGCAATYRPPSTPPTRFIRPLQGERAATFEAAKRALVLDGYTIQTTDAAAGIISTAPRTHRLTADDCDCGTTLGLPYIKDKRTQTTVAMGVIVSESTLTIAPSIHGSYLPSDMNQSISFDCVSKGTLERALFEKIVGQVNR